MTLLLHLRIAGVLMLLLATLNLVIPRRFHWKEEMARLSLLNRRIFQVHCLFIVLVLVMMGLLSALGAPLLVAPGTLPVVMLAGITVFWALRLYAQFCIYDTSIWRGNRFNTRAHVVFSALWVYFVVVFGAALLRGVRSLG